MSTSASPEYLPAHERRYMHDDYLCSLVNEPHGEYWACLDCRRKRKAAVAVRLGPSRPGPQPHNQIGTFEEQLARAKQGRQPEPLSQAEVDRLAVTIEIHGEQLAPVLMEILAEPMAQLVALLIQDNQRRAS